MERILVSRRLTERYVGTCSHLDHWQTLGTVAATPSRMTHQPGDDGNDPDPSEGARFSRFVKLPAGLTRRARIEWRLALAQSLSREGCHHDYDCCGCASYHTRAYPTRHPRIVALVTAVSYNY